MWHRVPFLMKRQNMTTKHNREFLAKTLNDQLGSQLTLREAERIVSVLVDAMIEAVLESSEIQLNNYGKLSVVERAERIGAHPRTHAPITIPKKRTLKFKISPKFEKTLNAQ